MELFNRFAHSLNIVVVSEIRGSLDPSVVRRSLDLVQELHPSLKSHIIGNTNNLRFVTEGTEKIPLQTIHLDSENWNSIVERELNQRIESEKVLVKATLVKYSKGSLNHLITTIHHAIADALSGINLHKKILEFYCEILGGITPNVSPMQKLPSLKFLMDKKIGKDLENKTISKDFIDPISKPQISKLQTSNFATHLERTCKIFHKRLNLDSSIKLMARCKEEGVTVHGAICAAMMFSVAKLIHVDDQGLYFSCRSSVDMRRRIDPPISNDHLSMIVSALTSIHKLTDKTDFWELAFSVTEQIQQRLQTSEIHAGVLNYRKGAEKLLAHPEFTPFSIFVTNIGKVQIPKDYRYFSLENVNYALSTTVMGNVFGVAVSTFLEQTTFNFIFTHPLINQKTMDYLIEETIILLMDA
ncbi:MAG: putative protein containing a NRPS condensation (elongation) domain [Phormidium sp. OSCR]|nr:MAG: putative protein containing a NRPS condensation (elongation) domain [Phormidium sp. OSCR]